jgi:hypothetical protein
VQASFGGGGGDADRGEDAPVGHLRPHEREPEVNVVDAGDDAHPAGGSHCRNQRRRKSVISAPAAGTIINGQL